jgi:TetR/AcrR family transcriptional regulator, upper aerobic nicotinate degradation pathway regulator
MKRHSQTKSRDPDYSADKLMLAALELFSKRDFSSVTIKDIAARSGFNPALIYYYYKNKEDLFRAAVEFAIGKAMGRYVELGIDGSEPESLIEKWFRNNLEMAPLIRQLVKIMVDYSGAENRIPRIDALIANFYAMEQDAILAKSIRKGISSGLFKRCDAKALANFVSVHLDGIMVASIIRPDLDVAKAIADLRKVFFGVLKPESPVREISATEA